MAVVTSIVDHWLEWEIAEWFHREGSIQQLIKPWADALPWSYISLPNLYLMTKPTHFISGHICTDTSQHVTEVCSSARVWISWALCTTEHYCQVAERMKEGNVLFNDALNTFYLRLYGVRHMIKNHSDSERGNRCRHRGYYFHLAARVLLYASSHRQDNTYHSICYTSLGH